MPNDVKIKRYFAGTETMFIDSSNNAINVESPKKNQTTIWVDTDKNMKYDLCVQIKDEKRKIIKLDESKHDVASFQKKIINEFKEKQKKIAKSELKINGEIEEFQQGKTGDCWLLASIYALSQTKEGKKTIKNMISQDKKSGNVTVKLPNIGKKYTLSPEEIINAKEYLSRGDDDVRAIELACEKNRKEIFEDINASNNSSNNSIFGIKHLNHKSKKNIKLNLSDPLSGGRSDEAFTVFLGKQNIVDRPNTSTKDILKTSCLNQLYPTQTDKTLDMIKNKTQRYASTCSFNFSFNNNVIPRHLYAVEKVDNNSVTIVNPWDSSKKQILSKAEFNKYIEELSVYDTKK